MSDRQKGQSKGIEEDLVLGCSSTSGAKYLSGKSFQRGVAIENYYYIVLLASRPSSDSLQNQNDSQ